MRAIRLMQGLILICLSLFGSVLHATPDDDVLAVIVAPGFDTAVSSEELTLIYKRKKLFWPDDSKVQPVNLPSSDPLRYRFSQAVLGAAPEDMEKYWNDMYFHGVSPPYVLASQEAVIRFVVSTPGAIGYVPYCSVRDRARIVLVITAEGRVGDKRASVRCDR